MNDKSKHRYNVNLPSLRAREEGFGWGCGAPSTPADGEEAAGRIPPRAEKGRGVERFSAGGCSPTVPAAGFG